jgi:hypothetical protein
LALGLVVASWHVSLRAGAQAPGDARAAIQDLLDARADAFLERDEDAFLATVSRSDPDFYRRQRRLFRWAAAVPFGSYRLVAHWDRYSDLARTTDLARYPGAERVAIPVTEERYRIEGFDAQEAVEDIFFTFIEEEGRWRIADDDDLEHVGLASARHAWDFGPLTSVRSPHFLLLRHRCGSRVGCQAGSGVLDLAEQALRRVNRYWDLPWRQRVVIVAPSTTKELARILQTTFDLDNFVAFAASGVDAERGLNYVGHRVLFNPESISDRPSSQVLTVLAHELLHVATRPHAGPFVPVFLDEGIAEYVGYDANPDALSYFNASVVAAGDFDGRLPADVEFLTGGRTDIYTSYQEAQSAVRFFVDSWGLQRLQRFYQRLGDRAIVPGTTRYHVDRTLRSTIGIGLAGFEESWADSIGSS